MADDHNSFTERLLRDAGIVPGMRVVDVGCGHGEVTLLLARLVGTAGEVIGIDREPRALDIAAARTRDAGHAQVRFVAADLADPSLEPDSFDAAVGRRVLMYLPDPLASLRRIVAAVRSGGVVAFQESDSTMGPGRLEALPLHDRVHQWIWTTVEREGGDLHMGFRLPSLLVAAGLAVEQVRAEAVLQGNGAYHALPAIVRALLPRMLRQRVTSEEEIDIETLERRLAEERPSNETIYVSDMAFGAWARKR